MCVVKSCFLEIDSETDFYAGSFLGIAVGSNACKEVRDKQDCAGREVEMQLQ